MKTLKTILRWVGGSVAYLLVLAAAWLPAVFFNGIAGYLPGLMVTLVSLFSLGSMLWLRHGLQVETQLTDVACVRGGQVELGLRLTNRTLLCPPKANAYLTISDLFGEEDSMKCIPFTLPGRESVTFDFGMELHHIGRYDVGLDHLEISGILGLHTIRVPLTGRFTAIVTPRLRPMEEVRRESRALAETNRETRVAVVGGTDYTGVREYALGDPMKQIHWKLSAHTRTYLTKLQESNRQQEFTVVLDFAAEKNRDREELMELNDCLIETALSLIAEIAHLDAGYSLLYCDRQGSVARSVPTAEEDQTLIESFSFVHPDPPSTYPDGCQLLEREGRVQNRSTNVLVVTSRITPELLTQLQLIKRQRRNPSLYYIHPAVWNSRQIQQATAPLSQLEEGEIPYFLISTQANQQAEQGGEG